jgi:hypothetical protein
LPGYLNGPYGDIRKWVLAQIEETHKRSQVSRWDGTITCKMAILWRSLCKEMRERGPARAMPPRCTSSVIRQHCQNNGHLIPDGGKTTDNSRLEERRCMLHRA